MDNILGVADIGHSLNHIHEIGGIGKVLHWIIHGPPQLIPNEVEDTKTFFIRCHSIEKIGSKIPKSGHISNLRVDSGTEELIEIIVVRIELVRFALNGRISARKHEGELLGLVFVLIVHGGAPFILRTKTQEPREGHVVNCAFLALSCPCDGVVMGIEVVGAMELSKDFFVPIIPKAHDVVEPDLLTLVNH
jgi:hypothetical protein